MFTDCSPAAGALVAARLWEVDSAKGFATLAVGKSSLSPELQAELTRIAQDRGTIAEAVAREAIERLVDYDDWFVLDEKGLGIRQTSVARPRAHG